MKVIFLDVDGVLNSIGWMKKNDGNKHGNFEINPENVKMLKEIVDKTGAKIVLSSTWRNVDGTDGEPRHPMYDYLVGELRKLGMEIFSRTPLINNDRPKEIKKWLDETSFDIESFISIDDDFSEKDYEKQGVCNRLIKTQFWDENGGLQRNHVEQAIQLLNE